MSLAASPPFAVISARMSAVVNVATGMERTALSGPCSSGAPRRMLASEAAVIGAPPPNIATAVDAGVADVARGGARLGVVGALREVDTVAVELANVLVEVGALAFDVVVVLDGAADVAQTLSGVAGGSLPPGEACPMVADVCPVSAASVRGSPAARGGAGGCG
ncbi:uncharacterized protein IUM83_09699 [Phytophthora cinnamomi]|uniref:uncharacterized protein n=1 Tax=Phytophthora cinnamomi TaxID=4785 RepID=UPI00355A8F9C|nr:hypothetical protein IUM83_09699 [Phytophthora cinnamomi]